jgi:hypothetical protein
VTAELRHRRAIVVGHNAVYDIMRRLGLRGPPDAPFPKARRSATSAGAALRRDIAAICVASRPTVSPWASTTYQFRWRSDGIAANEIQMSGDFVRAAPNELRMTDIERHEVLCDRAVMKGHRLRLVAAGR